MPRQRADGQLLATLPTVIDAIIKALEKAMPEARHGRALRDILRRALPRRAPRQRQTFDCHDSGHGGWGACATHDGAGPFRTMAHGDTRIIPLSCRVDVPYRISEFSLREDSGGPGKFRGGLGFRKRYDILGPCNLQAMFDRVKCKPWVVAGVMEAKSGQITIVKKSGDKKIMYKSKAYPLEPGDAIIVETGGGGGYGPPSERPRELIERDLRRGYVTAESAASDYGTVAEKDESGRRRDEGGRIKERKTRRDHRDGN
jgi:N-methylhydantoinase B